MNHWKSGASSEEMEKVRVGNAKVLKGRVDELFEENPKVYLVLAGDFNADYNQKQGMDCRNGLAGCYAGTRG